MCKKSASDILVLLQQQNLPFDSQQLQVVYAALMKKYPDYFSITKQLPEIDAVGIISEMQIGEMYAFLNKVELPCGVLGICGAFDLLNDNLMNRLLSSMALAKITDEDIELIVNGKFNMQYTHEDVVMYLKYFFDVKN